MFKHTESNTPGYFLCYYIPSKQDTTVLSSLLLNFKRNESENIVDVLCEWAKDELLKEDIKISVIMRSLNSNEVEASDKTSLDKLGFKLAESLGATYKPTMLKKTRATCSLKNIELGERKAEIENVYYIDSNNFSNCDSILIIDDIYTTGTTINEIIRAIKIVNTNVPIYFFTLGRTTFQCMENETKLYPDFIYKYNHAFI